MNQQHCPFCQRNFHFADLYDKHVPTCQFFYKTQRDRQRDSESVDILPSAADMFQLVKHLLYEQQQQKEKIQRLELMVGRVKKLNILALTPLPTCSFQDWVRRLRVQISHILCVFEHDLYEGMKQCLGAHIDQEGGLDGLPLRTSPERAHSLYIYSSTAHKWVICDTQEFVFMVDHLSNELMTVYCQWEDDNQWLLQSTPENKEKHVNYLMKMAGSGIPNRDRRRQELRMWLCTKVLYPLPSTG